MSRGPLNPFGWRCPTCGQELESGYLSLVLDPHVPVEKQQPPFCEPCLKIVKQIGLNFGEAFARLGAFIRNRGGAS
jgi:hypothetical protein